MKKIFLTLALLIACDTTPRYNNPKDPLMDANPFKHSTSETRYYKDLVTNLCFFGHNVGYNSGIFTNVPCTPEVDRIAIMFKSR